MIYKLKRGNTHDFHLYVKPIFNNTNTTLLTDRNIIIQKLGSKFKKFKGKLMALDNHYLNLELYQAVRCTNGDLIVRSEDGHFRYKGVGDVFLKGRIL